MQNLTVSISVVCRKEKVNQQNEAPLFIRLAYDSKRKFISLREKINLDYWDFENNSILPNCERKEYLDLLIKEKLVQFRTDLHTILQPPQWVLQACIHHSISCN